TARSLFRRYWMYGRTPYGRLVQQLRLPGEVRALAFTPDGTRLIAVGSGAVWVVEVATGRQVLTLPGPTEAVHSLSVSQDRSRVVVVAVTPSRGGFDIFPPDEVWLWDLATGRRIPSPVKLESLSGIHSVSADGRRVAGSRNERKSGVWDIETGNLLVTYLP